MPPRRAAAKAAAAKAWLNNENSTATEEPSTNMPGKGRSTRSSKPTTQPDAETVEATKPKRSTRKTKAIEPTPSTETVEVTVEEAPAPPTKRTRGRAASTASVEEAPVASKPTRSTRRTKAKEAVETEPPVDIVEVTPKEVPAPPARKTRGRAASTASVEEAQTASKPARQTRKTKANEQENSVETKPVLEEALPASKPSRSTRKTKTIEPAPPIETIEAVPEEVPPVNKPSRSTRKTKPIEPVQTIDAIEAAPEEAPAIKKPSRSTRKTKASEPVPSTDAIEDVPEEAVPEEAPTQPAKRTRGRAAAAAASAVEPLVASKASSRSTRAIKMAEIPQSENDAPPVEENVTRTRGKRATKGGTAKPKQGVPTRSTRSKRTIKEVEEPEEELAVEQPNAKRVKTDPSPEPVLETTEGSAEPEAAMNDTPEPVLETIEEPVELEIAANGASENVLETVEESVKPEATVNDIRKPALEEIEEQAEPEVAKDDEPEPIKLVEFSGPQIISEMPLDKLYGTTDEDEPLVFEDAQEYIPGQTAEPDFTGVSMATTIELSFSEKVLTVEEEVEKNEVIFEKHEVFAAEAIIKENVEKSILNEVTEKSVIEDTVEKSIAKDNTKNGMEEVTEKSIMEDIAQKDTIENIIDKSFMENIAEKSMEDVEMMDVDSSFLIEQEFNQTPEKRSFPGPVVEENTGNPSALAPLSPAAVNASHAGPTENSSSNPFAKPDGKVDNAPPQTPIRNNMFSMAPMSASRGYSFSHLSYVPRNPSPLRQAPLRATYSPSEPTPTPPRRRRPVIENGIVSGPGDPSPLRPEEISNSDLDYQEKTPSRGSRRLNSPVPRGRSRSRSIRRESSPLKNAVEFSTQESNESETPKKPETPKKMESMSPFHRLAAGGYDPNQEISELREEEIPMTPASDTPMGDFLEDFNMLENESTLNGVVLNQNSPFVEIISDLNVTGADLMSHASHETIEKALAMTPNEISDVERIPETPPQQDESDIPMSSPMATPMPARIISLPQQDRGQLKFMEETADAGVISPNVRRSKRLFEPKKGKPEGRHSTGSLELAQQKTQEHSRRSTLSGSIDVSAGPSRNIKHPRASEARSAYLGPPPTVTVEAYQDQFKSSVLGAPSGLSEMDSPVTRAETMSPVMMEELEQVVGTEAPTNKGQTELAHRRFGGAGADDLSDTSPTEERDTEMVIEPAGIIQEQLAQPASLTYGSEESSLSDIPSEILSSDVSNDDSESSCIQQTQQCDSNRPSALILKTETSPKSHTSETSEASKSERTSRIPLLKSGKAGSNTPHLSARLHRLSHTKSLTERELSKVTARNTTRNGVYKQSKFDRKVIRLPGPRPPSPTRETQSAAAEESRNRRKRVFEETGIALGPGDDTDYVPPELSPSAKRVKWHNELEHEFDEEEKPRFNTHKGILAPERVREDPKIVQEVTIQKFLYEGERDIFDEDYYEEDE
ncbi:hypothetical protein TWF694_010918 [Orbilia ellipsospora]|uniref:Uncharacterized protein n=1 Tax=Orbilia ellipsospora TaxID=2528407 RepID=A0AAV9X7G9_9PEZI